MTASAMQKASLPGVHILQLAEVVGRWGVTTEELLAGSGLDAATLAEPSTRVPFDRVEMVAERAYALTGEPSLGAYLGLQTRASAHGYLGFAAMTSATLGEALDLATKFAPTRTQAIALTLHTTGEVCSLVVEERVTMGAARELVLLGLVIGLQQTAAAILGETRGGGADMDFTFARPSTFGRVDAMGLGQFRFDQPVTQLVFPASDLARPLVMADAVAQRLAREQCERELEALGREAQSSLARRVRQLVAKDGAGFRSLEEVASLVGMSARTMKRRLADEETAFSALLEDEQKARALVLLRSPDLTIDQVASRVGYSEVANFTRAFRRWTGTTPAAYRRSQDRDG